jgi:hypothetical protein
MGDGDDRYVSKPPFEADLNVLCVDGTRPTDSAAFFNYLESAGKRIKKSADRVSIQNLLSLLGTEMSGTINAPAGTNGGIFPFDADRMKTLPVKKAFLPGSGRRIAHVLLPQGEVLGSKTEFTDTALGASNDARRKAAALNSDLLKRLCLAPGVSNPRTATAQLDFATPANTSTDLLYLSGHGSMAGSISGEADAYMKFFEVLLLISEEFDAIARADLVPPLWMVIGSCFSLRPTHAEIWLRFFQKQKVPMRGILGYQTVSPLADASAEINRIFANALAEGNTLIQAWAKANGGNDRWTALAFDYAKDDTLTSLRDLKRNNRASAVPGANDRKLYFFQKGSTGELVRIEPPVALLEIQHWEEGVEMLGEPGEAPQPTPWHWRKVLVSNLDFTPEAFEAAAKDSGGKYVSNQSWQSARPASRMLKLGSDWSHRFTPSHFYGIGIYPPFTEPFKDGFQAGDQIEISVVHVRQTYSKVIGFKDVFDLMRINGKSLKEVKYEFPAPGRARDKMSSRAWNRLRFACPSGFEPARIVVRYRKETAPRNYLWFWFAIRIERKGAAIFETDFDNFIMSVDSHGYELMKATDEVPGDKDFWTHREADPKLDELLEDLE